MKFLKSPEKNHLGKHETHRFPDHLVEGMLADGWTEIEDEKKETDEEPDVLFFDLSSDKWPKIRKKVQGLLDLEKTPKSKAEAKELLETAGYTVKE